MIRYLTNQDYGISIQDVQLQQLVQNDQNKLIKAEKLAQEKIRYYLTQRWDLNYEFTNTGKWNYFTTYSAHDRVILDYDDFSTQNTYVLGDCVNLNGDCYFCATASSTGTFSFAPNWTYLGSQYEIFYVTYPAPLFDYLNKYNVGDIVYWKGFTWSCVVSTQNQTDTDINQYLQVQNIPLPNVFPDDTYNNRGYEYWSTTGITYSVPSGTTTNNSFYWTADDNRCQQILNWTIDLVIYHLHKTIAPKNVPENRTAAYNLSIQEMVDVGSGDYNLDALVKQPKQGTMVRWGGDTYNPSIW